jgi:CRP/FNR family transcriptional regulator, anaerobic regulatory protein
MQKDNLYKVLFAMNQLPEELRNENIRKELIRYIDSKIGSSAHGHRQLILNAGQVADYIYFVEKGIARGFYYDEINVKEQTVSLWDENAIIIEPNSFFKSIPSEMYIEVMPGTHLLSISRYNLMEIYKAFPFTEIFTQCITLQNVTYHTKRTHDLIRLKAWDRYLDLLQNHPSIEQKISKDVIASYLGITPQSLSRLIKEKGHP